MEQNMQWVALRIHMGVTIIQLSFTSGKFPGTEQGTLKSMMSSPQLGHTAFLNLPPVIQRAKKSSEG